MSLHPSTRAAIRRTAQRTRSLLGTAAALCVEPSTVRLVAGDLLRSPRLAVEITDDVRATITAARRRGDSVERIVAATGVRATRVYGVLRDAGLVGRGRAACVLCGRQAWTLDVYGDDDAAPGDRVCEAGAGCATAGVCERKDVA